MIDRENSTFPANATWYLSGRSALHAVITDIQRTRPLQSVGMPSWCCESMIQPFLENNVSVYFYPVTYKKNGGVERDYSALPHCDALFVIDYFGYRDFQLVPNFTGPVICDMTHSIFSGVPTEADYVFGSLRKWAGFWTGGFAWKKNGQKLEAHNQDRAEKFVELRKKAMEEKAQYMCGEKREKVYLDFFAECGRQLNMTCFGAADPRDVAAARHLDIEYMRKRRRENAQFLMDRLGEYVVFPALQEGDCPLFVPVRVPKEKRLLLRKQLIEQEIYCPMHWPLSEHHQVQDATREIYDTEMSLVCDQRYSIADMERECNAFLNGLSKI